MYRHRRIRSILKGLFQAYIKSRNNATCSSAYSCVINAWKGNEYWRHFWSAWTYQQQSDARNISSCNTKITRKTKCRDKSCKNFCPISAPKQNKKVSEPLFFLHFQVVPRLYSMPRAGIENLRKSKQILTFFHYSWPRWYLTTLAGIGNKDGHLKYSSK